MKKILFLLLMAVAIGGNAQTPSLTGKRNTGYVKRPGDKAVVDFAEFKPFFAAAVVNNYQLAEDEYAALLSTYGSHQGVQDAYDAAQASRNPAPIWCQNYCEGQLLTCIRSGGIPAVCVNNFYVCMLDCCINRICIMY